ncbi:MAG: ABC transporter ATP-binding protein [Rubrivivax sp.]
MAQVLTLPAFAQAQAPTPAQAASPAPAAETDTDAPKWRLLVSPYAFHWRPSAEHQRVWAVGVERQASDASVVGASYFSNSFGQDSAYVYYGQRYQGLFGRPQLYAQWSVGMLYGYKGAYEDKVPLNNNGFSPGALLTGGWQFTREHSLAFHLLGDAGVMFEWAYRFK